MQDKVSEYRQHQLKFYDLKNNAEKLKNNTEQKQSEIKNMQSEIEQLNKTRESRINSETDEAFKESNSNVLSHKEKIRNSKKSIEIKKSDISVMDENNHKFDEDNITLRNSINTLESEISQLNMQDNDVNRFMEIYNRNNTQYCKALTLKKINNIKDMFAGCDDKIDEIPDISSHKYISTFGFLRNFKTNKVVNLVLWPFKKLPLNIVYLLVIGFIISRWLLIPLLIILGLFIVLTAVQIKFASENCCYDERILAIIQNNGYDSPTSKQIKSLKQKIENYKKTIENNEFLIKENTAKIENLKKEINDLDKTISDEQFAMKDKLAEYEIQTADFRKKANMKIDNEIKDIQVKIEEDKKIINQIKAQIDSENEKMAQELINCNNLIKLIMKPVPEISPCLSDSIILGIDDKENRTEPSEIITIDHCCQPVLMVCSDELIKDNSCLAKAGELIHKLIEGAMYTNHYNLMCHYFVDFKTARSILDSKLENLVNICEDKAAFLKAVSEMDVNNKKMLNYAQNYGTKKISEINKNLLEASENQNWFKYTFVYMFKYENNLFNETFERLISDSQSSGVIPIIFITETDYNQYLTHEKSADNLEKYLKLCGKLLRVYKYDYKKETCNAIE